LSRHPSIRNRSLTREAQSRVDPIPAAPGDRIDVRRRFPAVAATVAVCGAASNAGKTWLCEHLIRGFRSEARPVLALKVTRTHLGDCPRGITTCGTCDSLTGDFRIVRERDDLVVPGKDTARYVEAGADRVLWLLVKPAAVRAGILAALSEVPPGFTLVAEGNSFLDSASADAAIMALSSRGVRRESARNDNDRVDAFVRPYRAPGARSLGGAVGGRPLIAASDCWRFVRERIERSRSAGKR
jgi:hypothetical protein